ncbi:MAG: thermonuclease family protein [Planctomycetota bacterium]
MGTTIEVPFVRVVDGDTIRVEIDSGDGVTAEESLRILSLDTEESNAGGSKPVTPHGHAAKAEAESFFSGQASVVLEFPSDDPLDIALVKHRGNFGRLLVYVHRLDGVDFQEHMIRSGFSPYFEKYGYAASESLHSLYLEAEREAQSNHAGIWDQIGVNGSEINNYGSLKTWWTLRAEVIQDYRRRLANGASILNTRLDYQALANLAEANESATIFTEIRSLRRIGSNHMSANIGSQSQPFQLFIRNFESDSGQEIVRLIENRYLSSDLLHPRRSYAYASGPLKLFQGNPSLPPIVEMEITSTDQITDLPV